MTTSSWNHARRVAAVVSVLTVVAVVVGAVILAPKVGVPDRWWPDTGQAFTGSRTAHQDPCALIVGPGKAYCERGTATTTAAAGQQDVAGAAWRLVAAGAGVAALAGWRLRSVPGQRRR
ncbi:hypothetical protein ACQF4J_47195 (plasmid) [Streptomyces sp. C1-1]|uniref:hypothetical protein n=1 Tax=Streptomyces sp. C1-1 TaxID=3231173 RepID=UPI003D03C5B0